METESRWIKWHNLGHKGEDMDKVEEDNLEHKQSNIQRQGKLQKKENNVEHSEFPSLYMIYGEKKKDRESI